MLLEFHLSVGQQFVSSIGSWLLTQGFALAHHTSCNFTDIVAGEANLVLINTLWVVYTQWKGNLHNPSFSLHTLAGISEHLDSRVLENHEESS
jgi:hypothetical protein